MREGRAGRKTHNIALNAQEEHVEEELLLHEEDLSLSYTFTVLPRSVFW